MLLKVLAADLTGEANLSSDPVSVEVPEKVCRGNAATQQGGAILSISGVNAFHFDRSKDALALEQRTPVVIPKILVRAVS